METAAHRAALAGDLSTLRALRAAGEPLDAFSADGFQPIHWACVGGHVAVVDALLAWGGNIDAQGGKGQTPLGYILGDASTSSGLIVEGIDIGVRALGGMKEGGWRRLIVPAALAYRDAGLPASATASRMSVPPNTPIYVDVHMMDAGSGKCDRLISKGLKTTTCSQPSMNVAR